MISQQILVDNTANNLANVNTTGFKRNLVEFQDLFYATLRQPGAEQVAGQQVPTGLQLGNGVRVAANTKIFVQGNAVNTGNPLDLEITGEGFFQVTAPDGTLRYTRDGAFSKNSSGALVTSDGFFLSPTITIPPDALQISISTDGTVSVTTAGAPNAPTVVGNITIAQLSEQRRPGRDGAQPVYRNRRIGSTCGRDPRAKRWRSHPARFSRRLERRAGSGVGQPDLGPAGVRIRLPRRASIGLDAGDHESTYKSVRPKA